ncbi:MAG: ATP-binding protein [Alphaproteobacteria bacterium]
MNSRAIADDPKEPDGTPSAGAIRSRFAGFARGLSAAIVSVLTSGPALADDAEPWTEPAAWAAAALLGAALVATIAGFRRRVKTLRGELAASRQAQARQEAVLSTTPAAFVVWNGGEEAIASPQLGEVLGDTAGAVPSFANVLGALAADDASALNAAVTGLRDRGEAFDLDLQGAEGKRHFRMTGVRLRTDDMATPADVLWIREVSDAVAAMTAANLERDRFRQALDALPIPVWLRNRTLQICDGNRAFVGAVEAPSVASAVASGAELLTGPERGQALAERARTLGEMQKTRSHAVVAGSRRLLEVTERLLGETGDIIGYALDYTDVEEAQAERDRHIAAHREVLERLATPIVIFGADTRMKFYNQAYVAMRRFDEAWLATEPTFVEVIEALRERRMLPEQVDYPAFKRERLKIFTSLIEPLEEFQHLPDGRTIRTIIAPHPLGGILQTFEDLTDRLALERSYNTLIAVQRETLDNLYEGVAVFGSDGRLKLSNPAFARIWQLEPEFLAGEPHLWEIIQRVEHLITIRSTPERAREKLMNQATDRMPSAGRMERPDGSVVDYAKVPLPDGATLWSFIDATDRSQVERALRERAEALEAADRLKSEFIANVSYELRTPLNAIVGFAEILNNQYFGNLNARQSEYVRGVIQASNRLLSLINDILDLAMIEAGRMTLDRDRVDVHGLMVSVFTLARDWARKQDLTIEFDCPGTIGSLLVDERRLKQALFNLISNSVKFTPAGGRITVSAAREGDEVLFTVSDTGIGIPHEQQDRVFQKFSRGRDGSGRFAGVGLGLALVRHIIELHGGRVTIESIPNQGTRVTCVIPVTQDVASDLLAAS